MYVRHPTESKSHQAGPLIHTTENLKAVCSFKFQLTKNSLNFNLKIDFFLQVNWKFDPQYFRVDYYTQNIILPRQCNTFIHLTSLKYTLRIEWSSEWEHGENVLKLSSYVMLMKFLWCQSKSYSVYVQTLDIRFCFALCLQTDNIDIESEIGWLISPPVCGFLFLSVENCGNFV